MLRFSFPKETVELLTRGLGLARCASASELGAARGVDAGSKCSAASVNSIGGSCCSCDGAREGGQAKWQFKREWAVEAERLRHARVRRRSYDD